MLLSICHGQRWILYLSSPTCHLLECLLVHVQSIWVVCWRKLLGEWPTVCPDISSLSPSCSSIIGSGVHSVELTLVEGSSSPLTRRVIYDRLHSLLEHLLSLIPTLPSTLQPLLVRNFPHKRQDRADQETYIRNLLRITEYCPALSDRILATIIDRAIQIDVGTHLYFAIAVLKHF